VVLINARRYAEAERHLKLALELEPRSYGAPLALLSAPPFAGSSVHASMYAAAG